MRRATTAGGAAVAEILIGAAVLWVLWIVVVGQSGLPENALGAGCALTGSIAAAAGRRALGASWRPALGWLAWCPRFTAAVVGDTGRVLGFAARRVAGRSAEPAGIRRRSLPRGEPDSRAAARRAVAALAVSGTPSSLALDVDPEKEVLVVHVLVEGRPAMEEVVTA